jgi:hypothetical protein
MQIHSRLLKGLRSEYFYKGLDLEDSGIIACGALLALYIRMDGCHSRFLHIALGTFWLKMNFEL